MCTVNVSIQLLSGEVIPLELPQYISILHLYKFIFNGLPQDIRPKEVHQIQILQPEEKRPYCLDWVIPVKKGDTFPILISSTTFHMELEFISKAHDIADDFEDCSGYSRYKLKVKSEDDDLLFQTEFYVTPFHLQNDLGVRTIIPITPEIRIHVPQDPDMLEYEHFELPPVPAEALAVRPHLLPFEYYGIEKEGLLAGFPSTNAMLLDHLRKTLYGVWHNEVKRAEDLREETYEAEEEMEA